MGDRKDDRQSSEEWRRDVARSMRRLNEELSKHKWDGVPAEMQNVGEKLARGLAQEVLTNASRALDRAEEKRQDKRNREERRREAKLARRAARIESKRALRMASTSRAEGYVALFGAVAMLAIAFSMPELWWMVFVALAIGMRGAQVLSWHAAAKQLEQPVTTPQVAPGVDARAARIDEVCKKLLAALKDAPPAVRTFLSTPEQTIEGLRKSCHELLKRELSLRQLVSNDEVERLNRERIALEARIHAESDDLIRSRLQGALAALDHQKAQQAEVLRSANRLEAERTRLGYTLDGLYAQVMRVRTAGPEDGGAVQAGLRTSLDQLREEMNALADAVEQVNRPPVVEPDPEPSGGGGRTRVRG